MSISSAAVKRPVFTTMVTLIVVTLGAFSLGRIPVDLMPDMTYPVLSVSTTYENASPREVEELITKPMEQVLSAITGIDEIYSTSQEGSSRINLFFTWGRNLDEASNEVRDRVDRVLRRLPDDIDRPALYKFDTAAMPIMNLGVSSAMHPLKLKTFVEDEVAYRLERAEGVASVLVYGGLTREIKVRAYPAKVKGLGLDLGNLLTMIQAENFTEAGGYIDRGNLEVSIRTLGEFSNLDDLRNLVVARGTESGPVALRDVAEVEDGAAEVNRVIRINGEEGVMMPLFKQSGSNTISVADNAYKAIEGANRELSNVHVTPIIDNSTYIRQSVSGVTDSALQGGILALLVILFFLQNIRSTLILGTAIPISIVTTFMFMYFWGLTLNVITLGALALGVGMLVDNAIVVLENIFRLRSEGMNAAQAATAGANEVAGAIVASTLTTLAVFLPMIFLTGLAGIIFKPFAWTISFALISSLAVALTLVPMLSAKLLKDTKNQTDFGQPRYGAKYFVALEDIYRKYLAKALRRPKLVVCLALAATFFSLFLGRYIGTEFTPKTDEGAMRINITAAVGTRVEKTAESAKIIEKIIEDNVPERTVMLSNIGGGSFGTSGSTHKAEVRVMLTPRGERKRSVFDIMNAIRPLLIQTPGATVRIRADQSFASFGGGGSTGDKIQVELRGHDLVESTRISAEMKSIMEKIPGVTDVQLSSEDTQPEELIVIDRQQAAAMHLTVAQIARTIKTALGGSTAGNYREGGKEYSIVVSLKGYENMNIKDILGLNVTNSLGQPVILGNVAKAVAGEGPTSITRKDQSRVVTISGDYSSRSLGEITADIDAAFKTIPMPSDFSYAFAGEAKEQAETFRDLLYTFALAIFLVYMVMACQFEQLKGPLVVMFSVPFAAIGVILSHFITGTTFNINSFIGVIMLAGIVVNNAIILIDHANLLRRRDHMEMLEALAEAGRRRLRPILMTTLTTILGLIPLALGLSEGGESQAPLARAVIGGLASSTFITLFVIPAVYSLLKPKVEQE